MARLSLFGPLLATAVVTLLAIGTIGGRAQEGSGNQKAVPIYLQVEPSGLSPGRLRNPFEPAVTIPEVPVTIRGAAALDLAGSEIVITVTPPQKRGEPDGPEPESKCPADDATTAKYLGPTRPEPPTDIAVTVSRSGSFEAQFTPKAPGEHEIVASDRAQRYRGEATFSVEIPELEEQCEDIPADEVAEEAAKITEIVCEAASLVRERANDLPASPASDELRKRLEEIESAVRELPCGEAPEWVSGVHHLNKLRRAAPQMRPATQGLVLQFRTWQSVAERARSDAPRGMADLRTGNVVCDQLDIVINGLKFVDFYLGLIIKPADYLADWAKENVPTKLVGLIPQVKQTPAVKEAIELGWKGVTSYKPKLENGKVRISAKGFDRTLATGKMVNAGVIYAGNRLFELFCQQFQGPISGKMEAEFYDNGTKWWSYSITIKGQMILRYPKGASGKVIPLSGEIMGNATKFESFDNAIPIMFPKLAMGTVFVSHRIEPLSTDDFPHFLSPNLGATPSNSALDFNPITTTIEQGGPIVQNILSPAFFRVPVRGELRETTLRLELGQAATDFEDNRTKVIKIILPVLSLWPEVVDYALPYKGARFMMFRAMSDGPAEFEVKRDAESLSIERVFDRTRETSQNKGVYNLTVKACNPGC